MNRSLGKNYKVIMITGSSSQVGKALINQFSKNYIIICIDKNISKINKLENVTYFKADVSNEKT